jgi:endogenous inhibitor of DNA gyrase (YacG/DUF329 family)
MMVYRQNERIVEQCPDCGKEFDIELSSCPSCGRIAGWKGKRRFGKSSVGRGLVRRTSDTGCAGILVLLALGGAFAAGLASW